MHESVDELEMSFSDRLLPPRSVTAEQETNYNHFVSQFDYLLKKKSDHTKKKRQFFH